MTATAPCWWTPDSVHQLLCDIIADEIARLRPSGAALPPPPWSLDLALDGADDGLGADSLELLSLSGAVAQRFGIDKLGLDDLLLARRRLSDWIDLVRMARSQDDATIAFLSSGSTGTAKCVAHGLDRLYTEAHLLIEEIGAPRRVLTAVPSHHIYGFLFTVLVPALSGAEVVDIRCRTPTAVAHVAEAEDWIVGHPAFWRLCAPALANAPSARAISSTAPLDADTARQLVACGLKGWEIYGSTETAGLGLRRMSEPHYRLLATWRRDGTDLRNADGKPAPLQDELLWIGDDRFTVLGRRDGAVQVAGKNVYPANIARRLEAHPFVHAAAVRLMRPEEGERLKAFIVPTPEAPEPEALRRALRDWSADCLSAAERPQAITIGTALPTGAMGKLTDWEVAA